MVHIVSRHTCVVGISEGIHVICKNPREHQKKALACIENLTEGVSRAQVIMACGTGKTLLEMWSTERLQARRVIVFVPTLYLMQQSFLVWSEQSGLGARLKTLCVCSDSGIGKPQDDHMSISSTEVDFPTEF